MSKIAKRRNQSGFTLTEVMISIVGLASVAMVVGGVYVAIHFIAKFW